MARYSVNKVILVGHLGGEVALRYTANGQAVADFSLATSRGRQDANGAWTDETEWHRIIVWEKLATLALERLAKGSKVYVEGRIQSRKYRDRQNIERTAYEIVAHDLVLLDKREPGSAPALARATAVDDSDDRATSLWEVSDDAIPF